MPLLGKKSYKPSTLPKDLKSEEEVFVIKETNEVFRSYDEYVNRIMLYGFQVWSCQITGKTSLKYGEAVASEEQALKRLENFPKYLEKPVLQIVHHSSSGLQTLAQHCYKHLEKEFVENEPVEFWDNEKWKQGRIFRGHQKNNPSSVSGNDGTFSEQEQEGFEEFPLFIQSSNPSAIQISSTSSSPSSDKENAKSEIPESLLKKSSEALFDIKRDSTSGCIEAVKSGNIRHLKKLPSVEMLKWFIRANTENAWNSNNSPWRVKFRTLRMVPFEGCILPYGLLQLFELREELIRQTELVKKYSLGDKLQDFSLAVNEKKMTPISKNPLDGAKSAEKQKKRVLDESTRHGKSKMSKSDPSQRKLDSFRTSTGNASNNTAKITGTPRKQVELIKVGSGGKKGDGKTPSGELRGTPVKCRLVLTPVKSPYSGTSKSPANKKMNLKEYCKTKVDLVTVEDNADDIAIIGSKSPKTLISKSCKKLTKSPKSGSSKKALKGIEEPKEKLVKGGKSSRKLDIKGNEQIIKITESELIETKEPNSKDVLKKSVLLDLAGDSEEEFESSPKKLQVTVSSVKAKQSAGKLKQTTLFDKTKKPEDEKAVVTSLKIKAKKQKTLAEMFSAAIQNDKPRTLSNLIKKTAQEVSSPSSLNLNLATPQQVVLKKKWNEHKERLEGQFFKKMHHGVRSNMKQEDNELVNLKPLPTAKPVNLPDGITAELYSDIAMLTEFVYTFQDLLLPKEKLYVSTDYLSEALVGGRQGFSLLSQILVIFLQILLQERSTKGKEMDLQLAEMPVTQYSASEVSRLYLNSKLQILTAYSGGRQLRQILETLEHEELYNLSPEEKLKILVTLCHEVLASDALDDYMENLFAQATQIRKQRMAKQKERNDKLREEKEKLKKEKEELQKQKEEDESKKQLKLDELNKKEDEAESLCTNSEGINSNPATKDKTDKPKATKDSQEMSEVVKVLRQRREDMANKIERKQQEENERLEKEKEDQWDIHLAQCQYTLRLKPIGYDRNNCRYWVFNGPASGVYIEQGWKTMEQQPSYNNEDSGVAQKDSVKVSGSNGESGDNDDIAIVEIEEDETKREGNENKAQELSYPDIPYRWSCYDTVEDIQALLESLATQGIRESALKKSLCGKMTCITDGIKRESNRGKPPTKAETGEEDILSSIKEELGSIAESLVNGNLAILGYTDLEKYKQAVHQASCVSDLASQLEKLLTFVLPQFYQGIFSKDKANSEQAKQKWLEEVKKATTVSRLHLLLEILDSTVIWDMSAENIRCKVCRSKAVGKTLILCDECNLGYHLQCLRPALSEVPEGHWSCPVCKPTVRQSSRSDAKNYKEESGSEVEDEKEEVSDASLGENEDYCHTCGEDGELVCCDTCPLVFHKDCHQPPLRNIPRGAWSCWQCRQPKNKKQKNNKKVDMKASKAARSKIGRHTKQVESSQGKKITRKRSRSLSSEESGHQIVSKQTRPKHQPEASNDVSTRNTRRRTRACIESDDDEEQLDSNVKSFYGRSLRRTRQQKVSSEDDSDDDDEGDSKTEVRTNRITTRRNTGSRHIVSSRRSTRNQRRISDSSEDHDGDTEDVRQVTNQRTSRSKAKRDSKQVSSSIDESDESGLDNKSKRSSRSNKKAVNGKHSNKRNKRGAEKKCQGENEIINDDKKGGKKKSDKDKGQSKGKLRNSSAAKDGQKEARNTTSKTQDNNKDKRNRVNLEMNACEKILRDLLLHVDSWPFAEAVNLREVPDYLQFVTTPMDLGTIREKLKCLEYPDVESFVADVRLVFSNSDKYNLESSFVGKAGKTLETYFEGLVEENFSDVDKKFKVQRQIK